MNPGRMNRRITLLKMVEGLDDYGAPIKTEESFKTIWAEVLIGKGREYFAAKKNNAELSGIIKTRKRHGADSTMKVLYNGKHFEIIAVFEEEIHIKEVV